MKIVVNFASLSTRCKILSVFDPQGLRANRFVLRSEDISHKATKMGVIEKNMGTTLVFALTKNFENISKKKE